MWEDQAWRGRQRRRGGTRLPSEQANMMGGGAAERTTVLSARGIRPMSQAPKDTRSAAQKALDAASSIESFMHEGYVPNPEDEAIHQRVERGEITTEEAIAILRERALEQDRKALARNDGKERRVPRRFTRSYVGTLPLVTLDDFQRALCKTLEFYRIYRVRGCIGWIRAMMILDRVVVDLIQIVVKAMCQVCVAADADFSYDLS